MRKIYVVILIIILFPSSVYAGQGCCSWHGGESDKCTSDGRTICNDGTISPSCTCRGFVENNNNCKEGYEYVDGLCLNTKAEEEEEKTQKTKNFLKDEKTPEFISIILTSGILYLIANLTDKIEFNPKLKQSIHNLLLFIGILFSLPLIYYGISRIELILFLLGSLIFFIIMIFLDN